MKAGKKEKYSINDRGEDIKRGIERDMNEIK
jgi:hypothetical protein